MPVIVASGYLLIPVEEPLTSQATCDKIPIGFPDSEVLDMLTIIDTNGVNCVWDYGGRGITKTESFWFDEDGNRLFVALLTGMWSRSASSLLNYPCLNA
jgi:hypothetical protein